MTFEEFKRQHREKEAAEGTVQVSENGHVKAGPAKSDAELLQMYQAMKDHHATGVTHHGDIIKGQNGVLTLGDVGH